jgi:hypothetical protein
MLAVTTIQDGEEEEWQVSFPVPTNAARLELPGLFGSVMHDVSHCARICR